MYWPSHQPAGVRGQPGGSGAGREPGWRRLSRRRERRLGAALKTYRKFSQEIRDELPTCASRIAGLGGLFGRHEHPQVFSEAVDQASEDGFAFSCCSE
jgi:hypothetical protein